MTQSKVKPGHDERAEADALASSSADYRLRGRFWIAGSEETFLGYGRVVLLERIKEHGSITKAAASMSMSYRHAWELVESMNSQSAKPLVIGTAGGRNGGGTVITPEGERAIEVFWGLFNKFKAFIDDLQGDLESFEVAGDEKGQAKP